MRLRYIGMVFISVALSTVVGICVSANTTRSLSPHSRQSVYERVIETGTLRCGYFAEAPFTIIDPNTGEKSGIAVELAEKIAKELGVKLEWVSAENFTSLTEDLNNGRFDAICASVFNLPRAGRIDYTIPYAYSPIFAYTRKETKEFDNNLEQLDWKTMSIAGLDGEGATTIARKKFPEAKFVILPQTQQISEMLTTVAYRKADIAFVSPAVFKIYDTNNRGVLKKVASKTPFYVFNVSFGLKPDEAAFKNILDFMLRNMIASGELDQLFNKYDPDNLLLHPQPLYQNTSLD